MKKNIILYALSTAVNKGAILLFFPLMIQLLTLEDFGKWSLVLVVSNLLIPIMSLNGSAGIIREGSTDLNIGFILFKKYFYTVGIVNILICIYILFNGDYNWLYYSILIASAEGLLVLAMSYIRVEEKAIIYFLIALFKTIILLILVYYAKHYLLSLHIILIYHFYVVMFFALSTILFLLIKIKSNYENIYFKPIILFSIILIPHSLAQWIMSSSDRIIIEYMLDSAHVGIYSLAYNMALILMLVNSGIALALPTYMIKNFESWNKNQYDDKFIKYYTLISIILFLIIIASYLIDLKFIHLLGYYGKEMLPLIFLIYFSIYILGLYYFYANYLFFYKKAELISIITFKAAIFNVIFTIILIYFLGIVGAAWATLMAYIYYLFSIRKQVLKYNKYLDIKLIYNIIIFFCTTLIIYSIGVQFA